MGSRFSDPSGANRVMSQEAGNEKNEVAKLVQLRLSCSI
jgi:hypothetical protein